MFFKILVFMSFMHYLLCKNSKIYHILLDTVNFYTLSSDFSFFYFIFDLKCLPLLIFFKFLIFIIFAFILVNLSFNMKIFFHKNCDRKEIKQIFN